MIQSKDTLSIISQHWLKLALTSLGGMSFFLIAAALQIFVIYGTFKPQFFIVPCIVGLLVGFFSGLALLIVNFREQQLREAEKLFRGYFEMGLIGMMVTSPEKNIIQINDKGCEIFGHSRDDIFKLTWADVTHPDDLEADVIQFKQVLAGKIDHYEMEKRVIQQDGTIVQIHLSVKGVRKTDGSVDHLIALVQDITERKKMEARFRLSQKMDAVGQLTGGIAHDFNNILGIVMGNLELLEESVAEDEKTLIFVDAALKGVDRAVNITRKLLNYSRDDTGNEKIVSINEFVGGMENLIARSLTTSINTIARLEENVWPVKINPGDLEDALLNLSLNARDAMPDGGDLIIETSNKILDEDYVLHNPQARTGEFVMLSVSDTGQGMTPEIREKILEPFFTTKEKGKGTGLGLSMVYGFVQRSGGHIKVYSEVGEGTTFRIYLPRTFEDGDVVDEDISRKEIPRGNETILVVDDEEALVSIAASHLENLGYKILVASGGEQALKMLKENSRVDLLFTDLVMPGGLDGYQLALAAHKVQPTLKILITSGFTKKREEISNDEGEFVSSLITNLLNKPYNVSELAIAIRQALENES